MIIQLLTKLSSTLIICVRRKNQIKKIKLILKLHNKVNINNPKKVHQNFHENYFIKIIEYIK